MAGAGKKTFTAGEVLTASDVNTYLMEQSVMVFGGTAARSSAIPTPSTGMTSYIGVTGTASIPQIETYTGSQWQTPYGQTLLANASFTTASTITVANVFSATYDSYRVVISNLTTSTDTGLSVRIGNAATGYYWCEISGGSSYSGTSAAASNANNQTSYAPGIVTNASGRTGGWIEIQNPFLATTTSIQSQGSDARTSGAGTRIVSGFLNNTNSYTDFYMASAVGGSTMSGTIRIYGYRNS